MYTKDSSNLVEAAIFSCLFIVMQLEINITCGTHFFLFFIETYFRCCSEVSVAVVTTSSAARASYLLKSRSNTRLHSAKDLLGSRN